MSVLFVLIPLAFTILVVAIAAYVWAARKGQFDDLDTPAMRALHDDEPGPAKPAAPPRDGTPPSTPR